MADTEQQMRRDLTALVDFVAFHVHKMHRDISGYERARLADNFCCEWVNDGMGAAYAEFRTYDPKPELDGREYKS